MPERLLRCKGGKPILDPIFCNPKPKVSHVNRSVPVILDGVILGGVGPAFSAGFMLKLNNSLHDPVDCTLNVMD